MFCSDQNKTIEENTQKRLHPALFESLTDISYGLDSCMDARLEARST